MNLKSASLIQRSNHTTDMRRSTVSLGLLICLSLLITYSDASAQLAPTRKAPRGEPLEFYDNPPAPPRKIETSPRMISIFGSFVSYQVNVDASGQNILGDAANECPISVDPTDGNRMTIGWRQFNDVTSNFRQGGWGYTTDCRSTLDLSRCSGKQRFPKRPRDQIRMSSVTSSISVSNRTTAVIFLRRPMALDEWRPTWTLLSGEQGAGGGDKQWFTIDKTGGPGHGFQYQLDDGINCDNNFFVEFQRSTDGGVTWQAPIEIPQGPIYGSLDVDTNGNVFVGGEGSTFYCIRSSNAQFGGQTPTFDQVTPVNLGGDAR